METVDRWVWEGISKPLALIFWFSDRVRNGIVSHSGDGYGVRYVQRPAFWFPRWRGVRQVKMYQEEGTLIGGEGDRKVRRDIS